MDLQHEKVIWARKVRVFSGRKNSQKVNKEKQTGSKVHPACCRVFCTASFVEMQTMNHFYLQGISHTEKVCIFLAEDFTLYLLFPRGLSPVFSPLSKMSLFHDSPHTGHGNR